MRTGLSNDDRGHARSRGPLRRAWGGLGDAGPPDVSLVQRVRDGTLKHSSFQGYMDPVGREVEHMCGVPKTEGVCRKILQRRQALWMFVRMEGVEPTNNAAARAIRPGVLWRKGHFGTHSPEGVPLCQSEDDRRGHAQAATSPCP